MLKVMKCSLVDKFLIMTLTTKYENYSHHCYGYLTMTNVE